ncbi:YcaO-like family protein [Kitasatospora sp. NPDC056783]|uniref:YcaO-like family protein n=1 Tax=Kitasatospora sp. NPDC056783 TaxID=3345943 RepID=UPI0036B0B1C2
MRGTEGVADVPGLEDILNDPLAVTKAITHGTHRSRVLDQTMKLAWDAREVAGVSRVSDVTGLDYVGIPVVNTVRPFAERGNLTVTCGKGLTLTAAKVSALMEAIERYCGEQHGRTGTHGSFADLRTKQPTLNPRRLILGRHTTWTPDSRLEWWRARELFSNEQVLIPAAAVFTPYHHGSAPRLLGSHSDGLASGNCLAEAVLHGLYELIERDCTAFGETLRRAQRVRLETLPAPAAHLADKLQDAGIAVHLFMFSNEISLPTFYAIADDEQSQDGLLVNGGAGCHLDPLVAACRALTEAAQSRLSVLSGGREDLWRHNGRRKADYDVVKAALGPWLDIPATIDLGDLPDLSSGSINEDVRSVLQRVRDGGFPHVFVADLTLPDLPFRVVRVVVPGFEFYHQERDRVGPRLARALAGARSPHYSEATV